eukprot:NODE_3738_length_1298_cov_50.483404_g3270_i0.p1 GENE.NODE_3738_length_1298_cov_50.483404_g3270_i0~~NODE_3738_length_1298_cov_50.483404_g3270_i0.p1  ORF type:complete len:390 (+),score=101.33 NODE_3738_length_1298_cov_50.483404_g3270_i0:53-1171(+)
MRSNPSHNSNYNTGPQPSYPPQGQTYGTPSYPPPIGLTTPLGLPPNSQQPYYSQPGSFPTDDDRGMGKIAAGAAGVVGLGAAAYGIHNYVQSNQNNPQGNHSSGPGFVQQAQQWAHQNPNQAIAAGVAAGVVGVGAVGLGAYAYHQHNQQNNQPQGPQQGGVQLPGGNPQTGGQGQLAFFGHLQGQQNGRNYIIIVDRSGSMAGSRWTQASNAVSHLAPYVCRCDPDGITLYLFNNKFVKFDHLRSPHDVERIFRENKPGASTNLAGVLKAAFDEHFAGGKPTTILVITDGEPDSKEQAKSCIISAANRIHQDSDLSVSFIQVGNDEDASKFLRSLDDDLKGSCRFDIVDTLKFSDMMGMNMDDIIQLSIHD